jgi:hypothetical protein
VTRGLLRVGSIHSTCVSIEPDASLRGVCPHVVWTNPTLSVGHRSASELVLHQEGRGTPHTADMAMWHQYHRLHRRGRIAGQAYESQSLVPLALALDTDYSPREIEQT